MHQEMASQTMTAKSLCHKTPAGRQAPEGSEAEGGSGQVADIKVNFRLAKPDSDDFWENTITERLQVHNCWNFLTFAKISACVPLRGCPWCSSQHMQSTAWSRTFSSGTSHPWQEEAESLSGFEVVRICLQSENITLDTYPCAQRYLRHI